MYLENSISDSEQHQFAGSLTRGGSDVAGARRPPVEFAEKLFFLYRSINDDGLERCRAGPPSQKQLWQVVLR